MFLLASFHLESAPPIPEQSCLAYARYLCSHYGEHDGVLNADALVEVQELAADMSVEDVQEAILKTAEAVGSILCLHFNEPRNCMHGGDGMKMPNNDQIALYLAGIAPADLVRTIEGLRGRIKRSPLRSA